MFFVFVVWLEALSPLHFIFLRGPVAFLSSKSQDLPVDNLVVGVPSMSAIGRHLADQCPNLQVRLGPWVGLGNQFLVANVK